MNLDWLARFLGYEVVWLLDYDGETNKRWARKTPFGLTCWRMFPLSKVLLHENGKVSGTCYVVAWAGSVK